MEENGSFLESIRKMSTGMYDTYLSTLHHRVDVTVPDYKSRAALRYLCTKAVCVWNGLPMEIVLRIESYMIKYDKRCVYCSPNRCVYYG